MRLRLHHVLVVGGLVAGLAAAVLIPTAPRFIGWCFFTGAGLAGGAFLAAMLSGDALASGPRPAGGRGGRGPTRPAWFDEPDEAAPPARDKGDAHGTDGADGGDALR